MPGRLPDSQRALADYLDDMLHQATSEAPGKPVVDKEKPSLLVEQMLHNAAGAAARDAQQTAVTPAPVADTIPAPLKRAAPADIDYPMQCLMFHVAGHLLSIPLIQLSSVVDWNDSITRLPQSPDWLLGLIKYRQSNLRIVDSRHLLGICYQTAGNPRHLLVLAEGGWAITCDQLGQVVNLEHADVQWKPGNGDSMVLGTIRDSLATMLNPPGIVQELDSRTAPAGD